MPHPSARDMEKRTIYSGGPCAPRSGCSMTPEEENECCGQPDVCEKFRAFPEPPVTKRNWKSCHKPPHTHTKAFMLVTLTRSPGPQALAGDKTRTIEGEAGGSGSNMDCEEVARKKRKRTRREACFKEFTNFRCHREPKPEGGPRTAGLASEGAKVTSAQPVPVGWWGGESEEAGFSSGRGVG